MAGVTVQQILQEGYAAFERSHPLADYVRKAVWALLACRTARLGGHIQACPEGHVERVWYNSCRHRLCPQCAWLQVERWLVRQKARLLACDHYHVIFTLPDELRGLWLANGTVMPHLLFATVWETLGELLRDEQYLGARVGIIAALHTWSQTLVFHPHLHCLVTGGGLTDAGQWRVVRTGFLLPVRVVMAVFRGKLLAALRQGWARGQLTVPEGRSRQQREKLCNKLGRTKWNVHIRERDRHGEGGLTYLARYLRGGPRANTRLLSCATGEVHFWYRLKGEGAGEPRRGVMTLPITQFIRRYLRHVPAPGSRMVRSYGLYAPTAREALARCRAQVGQAPVEAPVVLDWQTAWRDRGRDHPERCPQCGHRRVCIGVILPSRIPPPRGVLVEAVA
jgi:Putative transposase/Transposase zinc-binding domain